MWAVAHTCSVGVADWPQMSSSTRAVRHKITHGGNYKGSYIIVYTVSCRISKRLLPAQTVLANNTEHELKCWPTAAEKGVNRESLQLFLFTLRTLSQATAVSQSAAALSAVCQRVKTRSWDMRQRCPGASSVTEVSCDLPPRILKKPTIWFFNMYLNLKVKSKIMIVCIVRGMLNQTFKCPVYKPQPSDETST